MDYLLSREAALTKYIVSLNTAASSLSTGVGQARTQGFEAAAISAPSRVVLLRSIEQLSRDLSTGLPAPTKAEMTLKQQAEGLRREMQK